MTNDRYRGTRAEAHPEVLEPGFLIRGGMARREAVVEGGCEGRCAVAHLRRLLLACRICRGVPHCQSCDSAVQFLFRDLPVGIEVEQSGHKRCPAFTLRYPFGHEVFHTLCKLFGRDTVISVGVEPEEQITDHPVDRPSRSTQGKLIPGHAAMIVQVSGKQGRQDLRPFGRGSHQKGIAIADRPASVVAVANKLAQAGPHIRACVLRQPFQLPQRGATVFHRFCPANHEVKVGLGLFLDDNFGGGGLGCQKTGDQQKAGGNRMKAP